MEGRQLWQLALIDPLPWRFSLASGNGKRVGSVPVAYVSAHGLPGRAWIPNLAVPRLWRFSLRGACQVPSVVGAGVNTRVEVVLVELSVVSSVCTICDPGSARLADSRSMISVKVRPMYNSRVGICNDNGFHRGLHNFWCLLTPFRHMRERQ